MVSRRPRVTGEACPAARALARADSWACNIGSRLLTPRPPACARRPDFNDSDDLAKLGAEAFAFVNVARFAVPLRIGLALGTTPWVQENIVDKFQKKDA